METKKGKENTITKAKTTIITKKDEPNWLKWEEVQEKYPNQWVFMGCKDFAGQMKNREVEVLAVADTFDEIGELEKKNKSKFWKTQKYISLTTRYTEIVKPTKKLTIPIHFVKPN